MPLVRNYDFYDYIDLSPPPPQTSIPRYESSVPVVAVSSPRRRFHQNVRHKVSMNSTIHDPTDFNEIDLNANEKVPVGDQNEKRKKKRWRDLLFPSSSSKHSSRKDKENNVQHVRSMSSVSFRSEKLPVESSTKSRRREAGSLSRHRYIPPPPLPTPTRRRNMMSTSMGYSDDATTSSSSHTTNTDYEEMAPQQKPPSYVIYPAASIAQSVYARRYQPRDALIPPVVYSANRNGHGHHVKQRLYRSPTYHNDAFVNSHEWTLSRSASEMRLGIVGTSKSGKTSLVHRYLTSGYSKEDSPEGGRFKKEVLIEGQSHLLLIRDEGQQHLDVQFCQWVDVVVFVFSVTNEHSFDSIQGFAHEMSKYRNLSDLPLLLVGTKDEISEKRARIISEEEGRQLAAQMKRCSYYEASSEFGTNVERVFKDACSKVIAQRFRFTSGHFSTQNTRTPTPTHQDNRKDYQDPRYMSTTVFAAPTSIRPTAYSTSSASSSRRSGVVVHRDQHRTGSERSMSAMMNPNPYGSTYRPIGTISPSNSQKSVHSSVNGLHSRSTATLMDSDSGGGHVASYSIDSMGVGGAGPLTPQGLTHTQSQVSASTSHLPTPSSTPNTQRKNRRISNIFQRPKDKEKEVQEEKNKAIESINLGVGRAIPVKQGLLYKKSTKSALNREWKKKYVCLYNDGRLTYHQNLKDYMDKTVQGKEVFLGLATVKVSGRQRPRNTQRASAIVGGLGAGPSGISQQNGENGSGTPTLKSYESRRSDVGVATLSGDGTSGGGSDDAIKENNRVGHFTPPTQPNTVAGGKPKKRDAHRRLGSSGKHNDEEDEGFEIVTHNQTRWEFMATSMEERDEWVSAIEEQIEIALTAQTSQPTSRATANKGQVQALRLVDGNGRCADCGTSTPDWASLNLGTLICIECSGIHRNLGTHVSKVRSLELDGWPVEYLAVMQSIGNNAANRMWEYNTMNERKPNAESAREEKERWIDRKYRQKAFLEPLKTDEKLSAQLIGAVLAGDVMKTNLILAHDISSEEVNAFISNKDERTVLHLACSIGSLEIVQLLLWNNADIRALDEHGRSCLWYAQNNGFLECAEALVTAGLEPDYGCPKQNGSVNNANMYAVNNSFTESLNSTCHRDYAYIGDDIYSHRRPAPPVPRRNIPLPHQSDLDMQSII